ncbi:MAG TPA: c-type cytochrome [Bacteroidota bacterium]|nr:c-type cytochrome [Bacteroidota bacterium]
MIPVRLARSVLCAAVAYAMLCVSALAKGNAKPDPGLVNLGQAVYKVKCASCHGPDGKGDGNAAALLSPRPRDFTDGKYKFRSTESGSIPTDADLARTISEGLHGTAMPDWDPFLKGDSLKAVVAFIKSLSPRFASETPKLVKMGAMVPSTSSSIAAGKRVFQKLQCAACHGTDGKGKDAAATEFTDDWGHDIIPANLAEPWTFRGGSTARDIYLRFRTGLDGTPMPSYKGSASDREMWDLANYVLSLSRKPVWEMNEHELQAFYDELDKVNKANPVERGKYLVETLGCGYCHSPIRKDGSIVEEMKYAGGQHWNLYPFGDYVSYNLTSDKETGLGGWTDDQIKQFVTTGTRRDGTRMIPFPMPWSAYAALKTSDLDAVIAYLRTLPPVYNRIPPPEKLNIFSYLWGKFRMLVLKENLPLTVYEGNAGTTKPGEMSLSTDNRSTGKEERQ